jgi:hypothetical protein
VDPEQRASAVSALQHAWINTAPEILSSRSLLSSFEEFRRLNARRALKAAVKTVMFINKLRKKADPRAGEEEAGEAGEGEEEEETGEESREEGAERSCESVKQMID